MKDSGKKTYSFSEFRALENKCLLPYSTDLPRDKWKPGTKYFMAQEYRYRRMIEIVLSLDLCSRAAPACLDAGCFPGEIGRLLKAVLPAGAKLYGAGLAFDSKFERDMEQVFDRLFYVEFDPLNPLKNPAAPVKADLPDASLDLIVAGEIFEHLYSPLHFIREAERLLRPGGVLLLTTPNLTYIGNALRLLNSKSVFPDLDESHIYFHDEWRPHERVYTAAEIAELMKRNGLAELGHRFIDNHFEKHERLSFRSILNQRIAKLFYFIPRFRPQYIGLFEKKMSRGTPSK